MNLVLAAQGFSETFPSDVAELFEFNPIFGPEGSIFAFNRVSLLYFLAAGIVVALMLGAFRNPSLVPGKFQAAMEAIVEFVREQIVIQVIGPDGLRYVPLLVTMFLFIFVNNFFEIMPFVQMPSTGRMAVPALLAVMVWTLFILVGFKHQGVGYLREVLFPPGVPKALYILVTPIELVSTFIVRPLTLSIRLFANMMAGHILLAIIFIASNAFFFDVHGLYEGEIGGLNLTGLPIGIVTLAAGVAMVGFEFMVAALQAYIFTILTAVYIGGSMHPEH